MTRAVTQVLQEARHGFRPQVLVRTADDLRARVCSAHSRKDGCQPSLLGGSLPLERVCTCLSDNIPLLRPYNEPNYT